MLLTSRPARVRIPDSIGGALESCGIQVPATPLSSCGVHRLHNKSNPGPRLKLKAALRVWRVAFPVSVAIRVPLGLLTQGLALFEDLRRWPLEAAPPRSGGIFDGAIAVPHCRNYIRDRLIYPQIWYCVHHVTPGRPQRQASHRLWISVVLNCNERPQTKKDWTRQPAETLRTIALETVPTWSYTELVAKIPGSTKRMSGAN